jgi:dynein heavy chain
LDFLSRYNQLDSWLADFQVPLSTWLGGLFNPQSFLISIIQSTARKNHYPIDKMQLCIEVTKKMSENWREIMQPPREGVFIHNIYLEGAKWDINNGYLIEAKPYEVFTQMPIICVKAIICDRTDNSKDYYECPVYRTRLRNQDYIRSFNLKIIEKQNKWILSGVAILLQP